MERHLKKKKSRISMDKMALARLLIPVNLQFVIRHQQKFKMLWMLYGAIGIVNFTVKTYSDGKGLLEEYRRDRLRLPPANMDKKWREDRGIGDEFSACKYGCGMKITCNFLDSVFFPWTFISNIIPFVIMKLNKAPAVPRADGEKNE